LEIKTVSGDIQSLQNPQDGHISQIQFFWEGTGGRKGEGKEEKVEEERG